MDWNISGGDKTISINVAPLVGAWIETISSSLGVHPLAVAPLVGAWIETRKAQEVEFRNRVAPLVGAWIETFWVF